MPRSSAIDLLCLAGLATLSSQFVFCVSLAFLTSLRLKGLDFLPKESRTKDQRKHYDSFKNLLFVLMYIQLLFDSSSSSFPSKIQSKTPTKYVG